MDKKKIRYVILKTLDEKKDPFIVLKSEEIPEREIIEQGELLENEGYIIGNYRADNTIHMWGHLTEKGEDYLEENSRFAKAYSIAKEIRDWIPFFTGK